MELFLLSISVMVALAVIGILAFLIILGKGMGR